MGGRKNNDAFTVVELLIVIVVIAILAVITVISYDRVYTNTQATGVVAGLKSLDERMRLWASREEHGTWPDDPVAGGGTPIEDMINDNEAFARYVEDIPEVQGVATQEWFYDNESDTKTACGNHYGGVNIVIRFVRNADVARQVDEEMDDGNFTCGRIRYVDERIFYSLNYTPDVRDTL